MVHGERVGPGLTPVPLSRYQAGVLRRAYVSGAVQSNPMLNLLGHSPLMHLMLMFGMLPLPPHEHVHFYFTGNRRYANVLVTNGESHGLLLCQALPPSERKRIPFTGFALEVVERASLPFLKVATPPQDKAVQRLALDHIQTTAQQFQKASLSPDERTRSISMFDQPGPLSDLAKARQTILAGANPHAVWADRFLS